MNTYPTPNKGNAVIFLRSRHLTADGRDPGTEQHDIALQRDYCQRYADQLGATVVREYVEHGGTGPIATRPVVGRMLADLRTLLGVRYVLVVGIDRLARRPADLAELTEQIQAAGANLVEVSQQVHYRHPDAVVPGLSLTGDIT